MVQTIFLLRHAESQSNFEQTYGGWNNTSLTELGKKQAHVLGKRLLHEEIDKVFCSDLTRAKETLESIGLECPVTFSDQLREKHYGLMEGKSWLPGEEGKQSHVDPNHKFENGESVRDVQKRMIAYFDKEIIPAEGKVLVVSHHNALISWACNMLGVDLKNWRKLQLGNCGLSIFNHEEGMFRLKLWNSLSHFGLENDKSLF